LGNHLHASNQIPLQFDDVRIAYLGIFSLPIAKDIHREKALGLLKKNGFRADWSPQYSRDFEIAESFLLPKEIAKQYFRLQLDDLEVSLTVLNGKSSVTRALHFETFLAIYPKTSIGILLFNTTLSSCDVDQIIFLKQSMHNKFNLGIRLFTSSARPQSSMSLLDAMQEYIKPVLHAFNIIAKNPIVMPSTCIEICSLCNAEETRNPERIFQEFPQQIYGMLVGDEGWRYVPPDAAKARIESRWGTRDFVRVIYFADSIVMMNFEDKRSCGYKGSQKAVREKFGCKVEEYFAFSPRIAGLDHGPLLMLENASVQHFIVEEALARTADAKTKNIKGLLKERERLSDALIRLSLIKIPEIGVLGHRVQEAMDISRRTEELKKRLEEVERTLLIKYNQRINFGLILLSLITLSVGILGLLIELGFLRIAK